MLTSDIGDTVRLSFTTTPDDPGDAVTLRVIAPSGVIAEPPVQRAETEWWAEVIIPRAASSAGLWRYRWQAAEAGEEGRFKVRPSKFY